MASCGGMRDALPILVYRAWLGIISRFQVRCPIISYVLLLLTLFLATSVDVERVFSQGRLLLSHVHSRLSVQSTRALWCLGSWSVLGLVRDRDVKACLGLDEVSEEEENLGEDWDAIQIPTL
jgi:hAT family C-terminal dimerisation region